MGSRVTSTGDGVDRLPSFSPFPSVTVLSVVGGALDVEHTASANTDAIVSNVYEEIDSNSIYRCSCPFVKHSRARSSKLPTRCGHGISTTTTSISSPCSNDKSRCNEHGSTDSPSCGPLLKMTIFLRLNGSFGCRLAANSSMAAPSAALISAE